MTYVSEILFVDPSVDDVETILHGLRPGVKATVLDPAIPAARQIALALDGLHDLDAVHVIAHGAPGRVNFASGDWSVATLGQDAEDLAAIGRALSVDGELRLWSCNAGADAAGTAFIEALSRATGADVAASTGRIGAAARGGTWMLAAFAQSPLLGRRSPRPALPAYAGVLAAYTWMGGDSTSGPTSGNWSVSSKLVAVRSSQRGTWSQLATTTSSPSLTANTPLVAS